MKSTTYDSTLQEAGNSDNQRDVELRLESEIFQFMCDKS